MLLLLIWLWCLRVLMVLDSKFLLIKLLKWEIIIVIFVFGVGKLFLIIFISFFLILFIKWELLDFSINLWVIFNRNLGLYCVLLLS